MNRTLTYLIPLLLLCSCAREDAPAPEAQSGGDTFKLEPAGEDQGPEKPQQ